VDTRGDGADAPGGGGAAQGGEREVGAGILGRRVVAVYGDVRDAQVVVLRRIQRIDVIECPPPAGMVPPW
jgi:hypothetical protein